MSRRFRPPVPSFDILFFCSHPKRQLCAAQERDMGGLRVSGRWLRIRCGQKQLLFFLSSSLCPSPFVVGAPWQRHIKWSVISCDNESVRQVLQRLITSMDRRPPTCNENQQFLQQPVGGARLALPLVDSAFTFVIFIGRQFLSFSFFDFVAAPPQSPWELQWTVAWWRSIVAHCSTLK